MKRFLILCELINHMIMLNPKIELEQYLTQHNVAEIFHASIAEVLKRRPDMRENMLSYVISLILADSSFNEKEIEFIFDLGQKNLGSTTKEVADLLAGAIQKNFVPSYEAIC